MIGGIVSGFQNHTVTSNPAPRPVLAPVEGDMSPQFKEQARRALHIIEHLDPDDRHFRPNAAFVSLLAARALLPRFSLRYLVRL